MCRGTFGRFCVKRRSLQRFGQQNAAKLNSQHTMHYCNQRRGSLSQSAASEEPALFWPAASIGKSSILILLSGLRSESILTPRLVMLGFIDWAKEPRSIRGRVGVPSDAIPPEKSALLSFFFNHRHSLFLCFCRVAPGSDGPDNSAR